MQDEEKAEIVTSNEEECRICRLGSEDEPLWKPCSCNYQGVHISCLERWVETRAGAYAGQLVCEVCHNDYTVAYEERLVLKVCYLCQGFY